MSNVFPVFQNEAGPAAKQTTAPEDSQLQGADQPSTSGAFSAISLPVRPESNAVALEENDNLLSADDLANSTDPAATEAASTASPATAVESTSTAGDTLMDQTATAVDSASTSGYEITSQPATAVASGNPAGRAGSAAEGQEEQAATALADDHFPSLVCRTKSDESRREHCMQSSPIYGVANVSSQASTPPRNHSSHAKKSGVHAGANHTVGVFTYKHNRYWQHSCHLPLAACLPLGLR